MFEEDSMINTMFGIILTIVGIAVFAPTFQRIFSATPSAQMLRAQSYRGMSAEEVLSATPELKWLNLLEQTPYTPWITASFYNDGFKLPDGTVEKNSVFIGINTPDELSEIAYGETLNVNMSFAERRIEIIFYKCSITKRASVRVVGKY